MTPLRKENRIQDVNYSQVENIVIRMPTAASITFLFIRKMQTFCLLTSVLKNVINSKWRTWPEQYQELSVGGNKVALQTNTTKLIRSSNTEIFKDFLQGWARKLSIKISKRKQRFNFNMLNFSSLRRFHFLHRTKSWKGGGRQPFYGNLYLYLIKPLCLQLKFFWPPLNLICDKFAGFCFSKDFS